MTERGSPRTEAGKAMLEWLRNPLRSPLFGEGDDPELAAILAVEAEASADAPLDVERLARALFFADVSKRPWDGPWMSSTTGRAFTHDLAVALAAAYAGTLTEPSDDA